MKTEALRDGAAVPEVMNRLLPWLIDADTSACGDRAEFAKENDALCPRPKAREQWRGPMPRASKWYTPGATGLR